MEKKEKTTKDVFDVLDSLQMETIVFLWKLCLGFIGKKVEEIMETIDLEEKKERGGNMNV